MELNIECKKIHQDAILPKYQTDNSSGMDLHTIEDITVYCNMVSKNIWGIRPKLIRTGISLAIPEGWEGQIRGRSSLNLKSILCQFGTIDSSYRGEIMVVLINLGNESLEIKKGDRIAQIVFSPVGKATLQEVTEFTSTTTRGEGGFGSTGK